MGKSRKRVLAGRKNAALRVAYRGKTHHHHKKIVGQKAVVKDNAKSISSKQSQIINLGEQVSKLAAKSANQAKDIPPALNNQLGPRRKWKIGDKIVKWSVGKRRRNNLPLNKRSYANRFLHLSSIGQRPRTFLKHGRNKAERRRRRHHRIIPKLITAAKHRVRHNKLKAKVYLKRYRTLKKRAMKASSKRAEERFMSLAHHARRRYRHYRHQAEKHMRRVKKNKILKSHLKHKRHHKIRIGRPVKHSRIHKFGKKPANKRSYNTHHRPRHAHRKKSSPESKPKTGLIGRIRRFI